MGIRNIYVKPGDDRRPSQLWERLHPRQAEAYWTAGQEKSDLEGERIWAEEEADSGIREPEPEPETRGEVNRPGRGPQGEPSWRDQADDRAWQAVYPQRDIVPVPREVRGESNLRDDWTPWTVRALRERQRRNAEYWARGIEPER